MSIWYEANDAYKCEYICLHFILPAGMINSNQWDVFCNLANRLLLTNCKCFLTTTTRTTPIRSQAPPPPGITASQRCPAPLAPPAAPHCPPHAMASHLGIYSSSSRPRASSTGRGEFIKVLRKCLKTELNLKSVVTFPPLCIGSDQ